MSKKKTGAKTGAKSKAKSKAKSAKPLAKSAKSMKSAAQAKVVGKPKSPAQSAPKTKAGASKVQRAVKSTPKVGGKPDLKSGAKPASKKSTASISNLFTPLDDRVMVERAEASDRTPGGLYIPEMASDSDRPKQGKVVSVGRGHRDKKGRLKPLDVQVGDTVIFSTHSGSEVNLAGQAWLLLRENEILAVVK